jgi:hypothetical protein
MDALAAVHDILMDHVLEQGLDLSQLGPKLDRLADAITDVKVIGTVELESAASAGATRTHESSISGGIASQPSLDFRSGRRAEQSESESTRRLAIGTEQHRVHFGRVGAIFSDLADANRSTETRTAPKSSRPHREKEVYQRQEQAEVVERRRYTARPEILQY